MILGMKKKTVTWVSIVLVSIMILSVVISLIFTVFSNINAVSLKELQNNKKIINQKIRELGKTKKIISDTKDVLDKSILEVEERIKSTRQDILNLEQSIKLAEESLKIEMSKVVEMQDKFRNDVVSMYEQCGQNSSQIISVFGCSNIREWTNRVDFSTDIFENNIQIRQKVEQLCKKSKEIRDSIAQKKLNAEELRSRLEADVQDLKRQNTEKDDTLAGIQADEVKLKKYLLEIEREEHKMLTQLSVSSRGHIYNGGNLLWPTPSCMSISSPFGYRIHPIFKIKKFHSGIDIPAAYGSAVIAVASGTVIKAEYYGGYGNCVVLQLDNGLTVLYAHGSEILTSVGQKVKQGQKIMKIGSSGLSLGSHLHYEVIQSGQRVDPRKFY